MKIKEIYKLQDTPLTKYFNNNKQFGFERDIKDFDSYHISDDFETIVNFTVKNVFDKYKNIVLLWSGGLDSTLMYYAFKKYSNNFSIWFTEDSMIENYDTYCEIIKDQNISYKMFKVEDFKKAVKEDNNSNFLSGELGDQIFFSNQTYKHFYDVKDIPYRLVVPKEIIEFTEKKVNKILANNINANMANWLWSIDFIYLWDCLENLFSSELDRKIISFFNTEDFQKWSVTNQIKNSRFDKFTDKHDLREYIINNGGNIEWVKYKTKLGSQRMVLNPENYKKDYNTKVKNDYFLDNKVEYLNHLFEINKDLVITKYDDYAIIIDNFYTNYDQLHDYVVSLPKEGRGIFTNDYLLGRTRIKGRYPNKDILDNMIEDMSLKYFNTNDKVLDKDILINSIELFTDIPDGYQNWPHYDPGITCIIYLDKICEGGTVVYDIPEGLPEKYLKDTLEFGKSYFRDVSKLDIVFMVEAKPNRMVLFNARKLHGAYIKDKSKYFNEQRLHQIIFTNRNYTISPREVFENY